jgi:putative membrane protein
MNRNLKTGLIIGGIVLAILILVSLLWGSILGWQCRSWGMMGPGMMGGFGWGLFMPVFMILFWGLIIWGVVALVRGLTGPKGSDLPGEDSALAILKKRYAQGDISREEYQEKKKELV